MSTNGLDWVEKNKEYLIKQAEMLQGAIARMGNNPLTVKQVGLTVWSAIVGFGFTNQNSALFVLACVSFTFLNQFFSNPKGRAHGGAPLRVNLVVWA